MRAAPRARARRSEAGLTIVELLVTIVVASMIAAGTFSFFAGQQRIYDTQTKMLGLQQSLWSSMDALTRYLRSAGAGMGGCVRADNDGNGVDTGDPPPGGAVPPQTGLRAYFNGSFTRIAPLWIANGADGAPDTLTVAFGRSTSGLFRDASLASTIPTNRNTTLLTTLPGQGRRFLPGELVLLVEEGQTSGDRGCVLFQVTSILGDTLARDPGTSRFNPGNDVGGLVPFDIVGGGAESTGGVRNLGELVWVRLAVTPPADPAGAPALTMDRLDDAAGPQVLAEGIEDMQIAYGCDQGPGATPNGVIEEGADAATRRGDEWTYNAIGDVEPARCQRPDSVRITLVARGLTPDDTLADVADNARPAIEDGIAGPRDRFRRRVLTSTVRLRN